jgi:hypothetical protein
MDVAWRPHVPETPLHGSDTANMAYANDDKELVVMKLKVISRASF